MMRTASGNDKIKEKIEWVGGFDFIGKKVHPGVEVKSDWRGYNEQSY
jgi:hypothetical protein